LVPDAATEVGVGGHYAVAAVVGATPWAVAIDGDAELLTDADRRQCPMGRGADPPSVLDL
jgi:hypothetical protein